MTEQEQNYSILWSTRDLLNRTLKNAKKHLQEISTFSTKNFGRGKKERKEVIPFCLSVKLTEVSPPSLWPKSDFIGRYLQSHPICSSFVFPYCKNQLRQTSRCCFAFEGTEQMSEAVSTIEWWHSSMNPRYRMTDYCNGVSDVLESLFSGNCW